MNVGLSLKWPSLFKKARRALLVEMGRVVNPIEDRSHDTPEFDAAW